MFIIQASNTLPVPQAKDFPPPSSQKALDTALAKLQSNKEAWLAVNLPGRISILDEIMRDSFGVASNWVAAALKAKGIAHDSNVYNSFAGEIWMEPGVAAEELGETQALAYKRRESQGKVALILGAGNVSSLGPTDALHKLFVENQVVILKMSPVNAYLGPLIEKSFRALIHRGFLQVVYGSASEGSYLCAHPSLDEIHITGSNHTHDAIVFGAGEEAARRKKTRSPILAKRITSELGNVGAVIIIPGPWSISDIDFQAENLVSMLANNAGFNCNATRVIVQYAGWNQREDLLTAIRKLLTQIPTRKAYYPGAMQRYEAFRSAHPEAKQFGNRSEELLPWMLISGLDATNENDICFTTEAFCSVFAETPFVQTYPGFPLPTNKKAQFSFSVLASASAPAWLRWIVGSV